MIEKILGRCKSHHQGGEAKECAGDILIVSHGRERRLPGVRSGLLTSLRH